MFTTRFKEKLETNNNNSRCAQNILNTVHAYSDIKDVLNAVRKYVRSLNEHN
jgi:hypothetical protein